MPFKAWIQYELECVIPFFPNSGLGRLFQDKFFLFNPKSNFVEIAFPGSTWEGGGIDCHNIFLNHIIRCSKLKKL
jgi:hypothetical protein